VAKFPSEHLMPIQSTRQNWNGEYVMRPNDVAAQTKLHPTRTSALAYIIQFYSKKEKLSTKYIRPIEIRARDKRGCQVL
jgi:hypothetical protein